MWHRIISKLPIPVDVPLNTRPSLLSGDELQRLVIKAIRLEDNWQRDRTRVRGFKALINDNKGQYVDQMQFLPGGKWLWTAQRVCKRESWHTLMSLWSLEDTNNACRVWSTEISGIFRSCAVLQDSEGETVTLVVGICDQRE